MAEFSLLNWHASLPSAQDTAAKPVAYVFRSNAAWPLIFLQYWPVGCKVRGNLSERVLLLEEEIGEVAEWLKATVC